MSSTLVFAGSKRKARRLVTEQRDVKRVARQLHTIYRLAQDIRDETHLQQILEAVPNDAHRAAVARLIEPFLPFRVRRVELAPC